MELPRTPLAVALLVLSGSIAAQSPRIRDSAGVRIVENPARTTMPVALRIAERPVLEVGGLHDDPDLEFESNQGYLRGVVLSNGGLAAIDVSRVKYFDRTGKLVKIAGRLGDGPGEFRYLTSICRTRGDTLVVGDRSRLGVLDGSGAVVGHHPSRPKHLPFEGCFADGSVLLSQTESRRPTPGHSTVALWQLPVSGEAPRPLVELVVQGIDFLTMAEPTYAATGDRFVVADPGSSEIKIFRRGRATTRLETIVRFAEPRVRITDAEVEERIGYSIPTNTPEAQRRDMVERLRAAPRASHWPAFGRVSVDANGTIWVADFQKDLDVPIGYTRVGSDGRATGRFLLPPGVRREDRLQPIGFDQGRILLRRWDEDGATYLALRPIVPAG
jgi:hypothetical protein